MTTVVINSSSRVEDNLYSIPQKVTFRGVKLKFAAILNNQYNVIGHNLTVNISSVNIPIYIPDGNYSGDDYAQYLQDRLNQYGNGSQWKIDFHQASQKFSFRYNNLDQNHSVILTFNSVAESFIGNVGALSFPAASSTSATSTYTEATNQTALQPGFYRICSDRLSTHGFLMNYSGSSAVVAIVPITAGFGKFTVFSNPDNFYQMTPNENDIHNFLDVKIFIEDTNVELSNPNFCLEFQFI